jgi:hypothetical protein
MSHLKDVHSNISGLTDEESPRRTNEPPSLFPKLHSDTKFLSLLERTDTSLHLSRCQPRFRAAPRPPRRFAGDVIRCIGSGRAFAREVAGCGRDPMTAPRERLISPRGKVCSSAIHWPPFSRQSRHSPAPPPHESIVHVEGTIWSVACVDGMEDENSFDGMLHLTVSFAVMECCITVSNRKPPAPPTFESGSHKIRCPQLRIVALSTAADFTASMTSPLSRVLGGLRAMRVGSRLSLLLAMRTSAAVCPGLSRAFRSRENDSR